jgi:hypothetical protein
MESAPRFSLDCRGMHLFTCHPQRYPRAVLERRIIAGERIVAPAIRAVREAPKAVRRRRQRRGRRRGWWPRRSADTSIGTIGPRHPLLPNNSLGIRSMKLTILALTCVFALSSPLAFANGKRHHHHWRHHASHCPGGPNGSPGGPTTLSGTGPSTYGGNIPGARGCTGL